MKNICKNINRTREKGTMNDIKITAKERKIFTLNKFISVPKAFLCLPIFNTTKTESVLKEIKIDKYSKTIRNVEINIAKMTVFSDLELFLFLLRKAIKCGSNCFEFSTSEMMDELEINANQRPNYFKIFCSSMKNLSKLHISYDLKEGNEWKSVVFSFVNGKLGKETSKVEISNFFIEFFNGLKELYELDRKILKKLKGEYQRILYLLYICNRMNKVNRFSIDFLKDRFQFDFLKMEEKKFIFKIREANKELQDMTLIEGFTEIKESSKYNAKTIAFDVKYSYASLYQRKKDLSGFNDKIAFDIQPKIEDEEEFFDDSYLKNNQ